MLLFDEINQKGFEGETVLNGLSEFFRNLMVCQDKRTLGLLETVEGFKDKYAQAAGEISLAWLISAIHILNESELNYKQARNKKLHIELLLIRLAYMQQALDLGTEGGAVKKKPEGVKAVQFRAIPRMKRMGDAKLLIETPSTAPVPKGSQEPNSQWGAPSPAEAMPSTQTHHPQPATHNPQPAAPNPPTIIHQPSSTNPTPRPSLGQLQKLRQQIGQKKGGGEEVLDLTAETLRSAWDGYIQKLSDAKNHSTATNLKLAELVITGPQTFDILTDTNIQLRFIEQERGGLIDHLQAWFRNRMLTYQVLLREPAGPVEPTERPLNKREQYQLMIEQYPLIQELKEKLNLSLD
jgi:DNA polymerase-3 subunit gamma/tau